MLKGDRFSAAPVDHPKRVNVGTATGIWAIDMADPAPMGAA